MNRTLRGIAVVAMLSIVATGCSSIGDSSDSAKRASSASNDAEAKPATASISTARQKDRVVISTAELRITTKQLKTAADAASTIADRAEGYIDAEQSEFGEGSEVSITMKVPADRFVDTLKALGKLGTVESQRKATEDVTGKSVDLEARLSAQRSAIDRLQTLVGNATTVADVLAVERELGTRLADLDSLQAQLDALDTQTQFATISVTFSQKAPAQSSKDEKLPGFVQGLRTGWRSFVAAVTVVSAAIGFLLPYLVPAMVVGIPILMLRRRKRDQPEHS